ncbi:hypothetical protein K523DRAFT_336659 [Schizophyllum commune Tattone D]|nr:hypothetical protein K523DRAFT_336659 [Schizophyllum commune Tattone D]
MERPAAADVPYMAAILIHTREAIDWSSAPSLSAPEGEAGCELPCILYRDSEKAPDGEQLYVVIMWTVVHPEELVHGAVLVMSLAADVARIECRVYDPVNERASPDALKGAKYLTFRAITPADGAEGEFNKWYDEEYIGMMSKAPTWQSSARFRLHCTSTPEREAPKYLAIHEWEDAKAAMASEEYKAALSTPWREKVRSAGVKQEEMLCLEFVRNL